MGTKSWVLKRTPKRDSQNWVDFFKKKTHFALRFRMFRAIGVKIWGSFKHPAAMCLHIYIYPDKNQALRFKAAGGWTPELSGEYRA